MEYKYIYNSPLGDILLTSDGTALTGLWFENYWHHILDEENIVFQENLSVFADTVRWLDIYFSGKNPDFFPPLKVNATPFRKKVCDIMQTIPYGKTISYGDIAKTLIRNDPDPNKKMSSQAVGGAVGHNPISIIIPCHRVIGSDNSLTGYGGGLDKKIALLNLEGIQVSDGYII